MVVMFLPSAAETGVTHDRTAAPSRWIVQAPHSAMPQPNFVPSRPSSSRRYQSSGVFASPSKRCAVPLTRKDAMSLLLRQEKRMQPVAACSNAESAPHPRIAPGTRFARLGLCAVMSVDAWATALLVIETNIDVRPISWGVDCVTNAIDRSRNHEGSGASATAE